MRIACRTILSLTLVLCWVATDTGTLRAEDKFRVVVFGDSLSDSGGNPAPSPPYFEGRWSNGYTYADGLAPRYGLGDTLQPSSIAGGTNYARAGARVTGASGVVEQIASYLRDVQWNADKHTLYVVFIGGNDVRDGLFSAFTDPSFNPAAFVDGRLAALAVTLNGLSVLGGRNIAVLGLPDLSKLPGLPPQAAPLATFMTVRFNAGLAQIVRGLDEGRGHGYLVDVSALFGEILTDAAGGGARFGITNVTQPCLVVSNGVVIAQCANPDAYLFWDPIHPTARVHEILADYVVESVAEAREDEENDEEETNSQQRP